MLRFTLSSTGFRRVLPGSAGFRRDEVGRPGTRELTAAWLTVTLHDAHGYVEDPKIRRIEESKNRRRINCSPSDLRVFGSSTVAVGECSSTVIVAVNGGLIGSMTYDKAGSRAATWPEKDRKPYYRSHADTDTRACRETFRTPASRRLALRNRPTRGRSRRRGCDSGTG